MYIEKLKYVYNNYHFPMYIKYVYINYHFPMYIKDVYINYHFSMYIRYVYINYHFSMYMQTRLYQLSLLNVHQIRFISSTISQCT